MKEPKHTPGPWRWVPWQGGRGWAVYSAETLVCTCAYEGPESAETRATNDANGTLIAAAPEMYDLLEEIARGPYEDSDCRSLCEAYAARARALLARADGVDGVGTCGADDNQAQAGHLDELLARVPAAVEQIIDQLQQEVMP